MSRLALLSLVVLLSPLCFGQADSEPNTGTADLTPEDRRLIDQAVETAEREAAAEVAALRRYLEAELRGLRAEEAAEAKEQPKGLDSIDGKDPSDVYFSLWLQLKDAQALKGDDRIGALRLVLRKLRQLNEAHPDWKQEMVTARIASVKRQIEHLLPAKPPQKQ